MFEDIRPYEGAEIRRVIEELCNDVEFVALASKVPTFDVDRFRASAAKYATLIEFQRDWERPFLEWMVKRNSEGLTMSGTENLSRDEGQLFLTNHRDITVDPAYLALSLIQTIDDTCEIAIGDNLYVRPWIEKFVKLSRSFTVRRNLTRGEMVRAFAELSQYVRYSLTEKRAHIWMAQREGRSKDATDLTQESLIKMLAMSGSGSLIDNLLNLNICPTTLSYEFDPCDYLKAGEMQMKRDNPNYKKSPMDDFISMKEGINGNHGRIHIHFGKNLRDKLTEIGRNVANRKEQAEAVCRACDCEIHGNYVLYPINYWAYEMRFGDRIWDGDYGMSREYLEGQLAKIDIANSDEEFLWAKLIEMYSNPVLSYLKTNNLITI